MLRHWQHLARLALHLTIYWGKGLVISFFIGLAINLLEVVFGLMPTHAGWRACFVILLPYIGVILLAYFYHLAKVTWEDHRNQALLIQKREQEIAELSNRLGTEVAKRDQWRQSGKLDALWQEASRLHAELENIISISKTAGELPAELQHPFSQDIYQINPLQWNGFAINIWKLQEDLRSHRYHVESLAPHLQTPLLPLTLLNKMETIDALALLEKHREAVSGYIETFAEKLNSVVIQQNLPPAEI